MFWHFFEKKYRFSAFWKQRTLKADPGSTEQTNSGSRAAWREAVMVEMKLSATSSKCSPGKAPLWNVSHNIEKILFSPTHVQIKKWLIEILFVTDEKNTHFPKHIWRHFLTFEDTLLESLNQKTLNSRVLIIESCSQGFLKKKHSTDSRRWWQPSLSLPSFWILLLPFCRFFLGKKHCKKYNFDEVWHARKQTPLFFLEFGQKQNAFFDGHFEGGESSFWAGNEDAKPKKKHEKVE